MGPAMSDNSRWQALLEALPAYLARQRWFPAKARTLARVEIDVGLALDEHATLLVIAVTYADGACHRFALPVVEASGPAGDRIREVSPDRVIVGAAPATGPLVHDDLTAGVAARLLDAIGASERWSLASGTLAGEPTSSFPSLRGAGELPARRISGEQSNTSITFGDRLILKLIRRLEPGLNPDYEIGRHLTDRVHFAGTPALAGALVWHRPEGDPIVVAVVQAFVPGATVLREQIVPAVSAFLREQGARGHWTPGDAAMVEAASPGIEQAAALGSRTGQLHLALADAHGDPAFEPEPVSAAQLAAIAADMRANTAGALDLLSARLDGLTPADRDRAARVLATRDALLQAVGEVATVAPGVARIRVHGDYQLDQVLVADGAFVVIDFEGEPLRPVNERRQKFLALKDVAGMARSYSYAAYAALFEAAGPEPEAVERLDPIARWWQGAAAAAFVRGYRDVVRHAPFVPAHEADTTRLLRAFIVEKATYELRYELNHRPAWLRIPLAGMAGLA